MDFKEIKNKSKQELKELLSEKRVELHDLRLKAHSHQLKQVHKVAGVRKIIAQIETVLATK